MSQQQFQFRKIFHNPLNMLRHCAGAVLIAHAHVSHIHSNIVFLTFFINGISMDLLFQDMDELGVTYGMVQGRSGAGMNVPNEQVKELVDTYPKTAICHDLHAFTFLI